MEQEQDENDGDVRVTGTVYGSLMDATESDHKPVFAVLRVNMPVTDQVSPVQWI